MREALQLSLQLLDEGLLLYRRNFVGFMLITASWFVPVAIAAGLIVVAASWLEGFWPTLLAIVALLVLSPLAIYLIGGLSRAAVAAAEGRAVRFREAMAIHPLRAALIGGFTLVYGFGALVVTSILSIICACPLYLLTVLVSLLIVGTLEDAGLATVVLILGFAFLVSVFGSLAILSVSGGGLFYGLQAWVQEARPFGESLLRSVELLFFRFARNMLMLSLCAVLIAAVGLTVMVTIGVLLPLPLSYALGEESPIVRSAAVAAWLIGLVVVLPPLPIWMALLYQRNRAAHEGADLEASIIGLTSNV